MKETENTAEHQVFDERPQPGVEYYFNHTKRGGTGVYLGRWEGADWFKPTSDHWYCEADDGNLGFLVYPYMKDLWLRVPTKED